MSRSSQTASARREFKSPHGAWWMLGGIADPLDPDRVGNHPE